LQQGTNNHADHVTNRCGKRGTNNLVDHVTYGNHSERLAGVNVRVKYPVKIAVRADVWICLKMLPGRSVQTSVTRTWCGWAVKTARCSLPDSWQWCQTGSDIHRHKWKKGKKKLSTKKCSRLSGAGSGGCPL